MTTLWQDMRYGFRMLIKKPGFTAVALVTLALGIGANTATFSLLYALLLRSLPVPHPERLCFVWQRTPESEQRGLSYTACQALREQTQSFAAVGLVNVPGPILAYLPGGDLENVRREAVDAGYFAALGLRPAAGRFFTSAEDSAPSNVVVISYRFWERHFSRNPEVIGATLCAGWADWTFTIVGVMAPEYHGVTPEYATDLWLQESQGRMRARAGQVKEDPYEGWYRPLVRLKPGVSEKQAATELNGIYARYLGQCAAGASGADRPRLLNRQIVLTGAAVGSPQLGRRLQKPLTVLMILVALVLLLACANIGNMLLARTAARSREIAIRIAVGAGRGHLVRQLLTESLLLAVAGGALGLLFACWGAKVFAGLVTGYVSQIDVSPDLRVLAFTAAVSVCAGLLFGLIPALHAARSDVAPVLKGTGAVQRCGRWPVGKLLVVLQVALSIVLVAGAGLFLRTLANLKTLDAGFAHEHVVFCEVVTTKGYTPEADPALWRLIDKVRQLPGVISASTGAIVTDTPSHTVEIEGYHAGPGEKLETQLREVSDGFFETLRTPLLQGRSIEQRDCGVGKAQVAVVNESFARRFFGGDNPLGRHVTAQFAGPKMGPFEIVGVVADARYTSPKVMPLPELYTPVTRFFGARLLLRTALDPRMLMATLPQFIQQAEPQLRVLEMDTVVHATDRTLSQEHMLARLSGFFGVLALILAGVGVFGVISHAVGRRTHEIGIRMALGASRLSVLWMVLRETLLLLAAGLALGIPVIFVAGRFVASLLYGLKPADPATLALAMLVLSGVALLAGYLPARRAAKTDPMAALRCE